MIFSSFFAGVKKRSVERNERNIVVALVRKYNRNGILNIEDTAMFQLHLLSKKIRFGETMVHFKTRKLFRVAEAVGT